MNSLTKDNETKLENRLNIVVSANSKKNYGVLTRGTNTTNKSTNVPNPAITSQDNLSKIKKWFTDLNGVLQKIFGNQQKIYDKVKEQSTKIEELQNDIENIATKLDEISSKISLNNNENKGNVNTLVDMAGSVQGSLAGDIKQLRNDFEKVRNSLENVIQNCRREEKK